VVWKLIWFFLKVDVKNRLIVTKDGTKKWYLNGKRHREDGPAIEYPDGIKAWYLNGELNRKDGPAVEYPDGTKIWFLNGQKLSEKDWFKKVNPDCELEIDLIFS